ncbi:MAG: hypothetical protein Q8N35_07100 [Methylococcaceae bacterium]|nr:hypothetical protein [Methylococcaceae bacterium]MDP3019336.1 hypothetical protein [Methylococcaceae bacterium]MDP3389083.1 hypothetical protein [Methylococcaceae bacterium]MDP3932770.1 hypothetical protein [Methylococcaceae bacterium]MDZ4157555.1 hypothetical protein [Methylococcales bacterium]
MSFEAKRQGRIWLVYWRGSSARRGQFDTGKFVVSPGAAVGRLFLQIIEDIEMLSLWWFCNL